MQAAKVEVVPGTLDLLVLKALSGEVALHGFGVLAWLRQATDGELRVEEGALYPALHRMEQRGWMQGEWRISEKGRRAKYYALTATGRRQLTIQEAEWARYIDVWRRIALAAAK
jgi:PadR family transcriptional regulator, regulatory protein PadR